MKNYVKLHVLLIGDAWPGSCGRGQIGAGGSSVERLSVFESCADFLEPGAAFVFAILIAESCFQNRGFSSRANNLHRNKHQEYEKELRMKEEKTKPDNHDAAENINRIPYARIQSARYQRRGLRLH